MKASILLFFAFFIFASQAYAGTIFVAEGVEVMLPVDINSGLTVQLPVAVKVATQSKGYIITALTTGNQTNVQVNSDGTPSAGGNANPANTDVRLFQIQPTEKAGSEKITFVLADDRSISIKLIPSNGGENFFDLKFPKQAAARQSHAGGRKPSGFMALERELMLNILKDEEIANRKITDVKVALKQYPDLNLRLVRTFQTEGLVGYAFIVTNMSSKTIKLNAAVLNIGRPNKAVLMQVDHEILRPCSEDSSPEPRGQGCLTALRLVARGSNQNVAPALRSDMPFVVASSDPKEAK